MASRYHIGVDLGGTKLEAVLLELDAEAPGLDSPSTLAEPNRAVAYTGEALAQVERCVKARERIPTEASQGYEAIVDRLVGLIKRLESEVHGQTREHLKIGIGLPGHISRRTGKVKNSNTVCLNGRDLWGDVRRRLERPVGFDNDANCLTLAEARLGAGRGAGLVFGVILGTGVGGGLAFDGRIWSGLQGIAGEWGHTILDPAGRPCYCGRRGCIETYLSGPALQARMLEHTGLSWTAARLNEALSGGETLPAGIADVWADYLRDFGRALSQVVNVLDPEVVVIGGGLSRMASLYNLGVEQLAQNVFNDELLTRVVPAELGDAGGVFGAALIGE